MISSAKKYLRRLFSTPSQERTKVDLNSDTEYMRLGSRRTDETRLASFEQGTASPPNSVFVSYSHKDKLFVDRFVRDLRDSRLAGQYDDWALRPGDSLLERINKLISDSFAVICVLSRNSIQSHWVKHELLQASEQGIPIIGLAIDDAYQKSSFLNAYLDKYVVADAQLNYLWTLFRVISALGGQSISRPEDAASSALITLENSLQSGSTPAVKEVIRRHPDLLLSTFPRWNVHEVFSGTRIPELETDLFGFSGQSFQYEFFSMHFCSLTLREAESLRETITMIEDADKNNVLKQSMRLIALKSSNGYGTSQVLREFQELRRFSELSSRLGSRPLNLRHLVFHGRRSEADLEFNVMRKQLLEKSGISVASYDRIFPNTRGDC